MPRRSRGNKGREDGSRKRARRVGPLRMPLHAHDEVVPGFEFNRLNYPVNGTSGGYSQVIAHRPQGLVMAGIDLYRLAALRKKLRQFRSRSDLNGVRLGDLSAGSMVRKGLAVLSQ